MTRVVIALGGNVGDVDATLERALVLCGEFIQWEKVSAVVTSPPMYKTDQAEFRNQVAIGHTWHGPFALLDALKAVEQALGRQERERNGPREIDLDIIQYGSLRMRSNGRGEFEVPHPRAAERPFVMEPWREIDPSA